MRASRVAPAAFGLLVVATFAAFFVAQRIKSTPSIIQQLQFNTFDKQGSSGVVFSPNGDGRRDRVRIGFMLKKADHVTLTILNAGGDPVRTLVSDRALGAFKRLGLPGVPWDGRDDDNKLVPDGRYRLRVTLRDQGRSIISTRSIIKDTTPPAPRITSIGPLKTYGPELLPEPTGEPAEIHFGPALTKPRLLIFRTGPGTPRLVRTVPLTPGDRSWQWDGTTEDGRRVSPGAYLVVAQWRDEAGNIGSSVTLDKAGLPILRGARLPGAAGSPSATWPRRRRSSRSRPATRCPSSSTRAASATAGRCGGWGKARRGKPEARRPARR